MAEEKPKKPVGNEFTKPTPRTIPGEGAGPGIHGVHVNAAREMVSLHTRGRLPPGHGAQPAASTSQSPTNFASAFPAPSKQPQRQKRDHEVSIPAKSHSGDCHNPQCEHCGQVIIPAPSASFPIQDKPSITINDWSIYTIKKPILNSAELDYLSENKFDFPLPEMIFGNNVVKLVNDKTGETIEFDAVSALDSLDPDCKLKVSYHQEWLSSRRSKMSSSSEKSEKALKENSNKDIAKLTENLDTMKPYDWTYSTNYKGVTKNMTLKPTKEQIPIKKLLNPDPILFFDESILFEDELGDNGISMLSTKIRVMPTCLLLLCRFFLRIDDVIFRIRDTRVYIDLESNLVLREYKEQEYPYDDLLKKVAHKAYTTMDPKKLLRDTNWVSQNIPVISTQVESNQEQNQAS
ncbi:TIP41-domain-containing protein [Suhomyces tanzawaensis NRRL Y-17324]|uniref:TIP41-domain-containing protein n=1 Tax=Suhomyces tanzawaensis NRRL Y-17324 TaxID=984487 RepID=A0A1E4SGS5_9ASCO|nr:TIP41-domain-containing protein [Suhomyces tanzawaensis NRRL Y-17324]ODV78686.1 TIP41-domain-containing protein [Suhomyces tanzawaensis NRRL Y-17324]